MRITDENTLREMRKDSDKSKRKNSYKVNVLKFNGERVEYTFQQFYDHSCDVYNPFIVYVYDENGSNIASGSGSSIEDSYNNMIISLIQYRDQSREERDNSNKKLGKIIEVVKPLIEIPDCDNCFYR